MPFWALPLHIALKLGLLLLRSSTEKIHEHDENRVNRALHVWTHPLDILVLVISCASLRPCVCLEPRLPAQCNWHLHQFLDGDSALFQPAANRRIHGGAALFVQLVPFQIGAPAMSTPNPGVHTASHHISSFYLSIYLNTPCRKWETSAISHGKE